MAAMNIEKDKASGQVPVESLLLQDESFPEYNTFTAKKSVS